MLSRYKLKDDHVEIIQQGVLKCWTRQRKRKHLSKF